MSIKSERLGGEGNPCLGEHPPCIEMLNRGVQKLFLRDGYGHGDQVHFLLEDSIELRAAVNLTPQLTVLASKRQKVRQSVGFGLSP